MIFLVFLKHIINIFIKFATLIVLGYDLMFANYNRIRSPRFF